MTFAEKTLIELVAIPSVNPAFVSASHPHAGEKKVAEFLAGRATQAGLDVLLQEVLPGRCNLLARLSPSGKIHSRIWLVPHMDTVNATPDQLTPRVKGGRLFGRGACDTKGSVAAMLDAICRLARTGSRLTNTEITFAAVIDEENAQEGSRFLASSAPKPDLAVVGEPTCLELVTAHKGSLWLRLETRGKSAHGARPDLGVNAVAEMARVVTFLEGDYARRLRGKSHALLGCPTVNVGAIRGGSQPNIVPDFCSIEVDRRTLPGETDAGVRREIAALLRQKGLRASCSSSKLAPCWPMETSPRHPLVRRWLDLLRQPKPRGVDYFCDAGVLSRSGIPSVVFGPGDIAQAHTADEFISLEQVTEAADCLLSFFKSLS
jgi:succinyl-diaminopimelate desuccinylase